MKNKENKKVEKIEEKDSIKTDPYAKLGVSSQKEGVHKATKDLDKGLYPGAFCQIVKVPSNLPKEVVDNFGYVMHSDGVGTKSNVAYLCKKEKIEGKFLKNLPQDALVMNIDDMGCVGIVNDIQISNHIARNPNRINDEDLQKIIEGYSIFVKKMENLGIKMILTGGETADVGSYTTTLGLDVTASAFIEKSKVIDCANIEPNQYIVGLASYGQSTYEDEYNSGIRSNGLTLAINSLLSPYYRKYPEVMNSAISSNEQFTGEYMLDEKLPYSDLTIAQAILSPTRTYLPIIKKAIEQRIGISCIIHCSGGGLTKSIKFGNNIRYVKDLVRNIDVPPIFQEIQKRKRISDKDMYQTFNMGIGMEIIVKTQKDVDKLKRIAWDFGIDADLIGTTARAKGKNEVIIQDNGMKLNYKREEK